MLWSEYQGIDAMELVSRNRQACVKKGLHTDVQVYGRTYGFKINQNYNLSYRCT